MSTMPARPVSPMTGRCRKRLVICPEHSGQRICG
jgi:hypothetical protein